MNFPQSWRFLTSEVRCTLRNLLSLGLVEISDPLEVKLQISEPWPQGIWVDLLANVGAGASATWVKNQAYIHAEHPPLFVGNYAFPLNVRSLGVVDFRRCHSVVDVLIVLQKCVFDVFSWSEGPCEGEQVWEYMFSHWVNGHSMACAFRGEPGHSWLASRQWLTHGPWKLHYGRNDVTFVQFYDYEADMPTMLEQARVAHERMGSSPIGGYLDPTLARPETFRGEYDAESRALVTRVEGRDVPSEEMLHAAVLRRFQSFGSDKPVEQVIFDFVDADAAKRHLHEVWLYGLICRTRVNDRVVDLNADYDPDPDPPEWAQQIPTIDLR